MTREEAKELLPIIQAYVEGKTIQMESVNGEWVDDDDPTFNTLTYNYRIKPQPHYRPFKNDEECWVEMHKHKPFGWFKVKDEGGWLGIKNADNIVYKRYFEDITFADGEPFGMKEKDL